MRHMKFWLFVVLSSFAPLAKKSFHQKIIPSKQNQKFTLQKQIKVEKNTQRKNPNSLTGEKELKKILKKYHLKSAQIRIKQEIFLTVIKTNLKSEGFLSFKANKFKLKLKGNPSSLSLFDGNFFWHQADRAEKVVFKLKNQPGFQFLAIFFNEKDFFKHWAVKKFQRKKSHYFFQLQPKKPEEALSTIFVKATTHIWELRLIWKDLNNWQKYTLSRPIEKSFPKKFFQFPSKDFQIITKF